MHEVSEREPNVAYGRLVLVLVCLLLGYELILLVPGPLNRAFLFGFSFTAMAVSGPYISRSVRLPITTLLIMLLMVGHLFFGNISHGPYSIRIYAGVALGGWMILESARYGKPIFTHRVSLVLIVVLLLLVGWRAIATAQQSLPFSNVVDMAAPLLFAGLTFVLIQRFVTTTRDIAAIVFWILSALVISSAIGILQWLGFEPAWDAATNLRPGLEGLVRGWGSPSTVGESRFVPGLTLFSIELGYQVVTFGLLAVAWVLHNHKRRNEKLAGSSMLAVILAALLIVQSRSAILAAIVGTLVVVLLSWRLVPRSLFTKQAAIVISVTAVLLIGLFIASQSPEPDIATGERESSISRSSGYSLTRIFQIRDSVRSEILTEAVRTSLRHPVFGVSSGDFILVQMEKFPENTTQSAPHNFFLNASVYAGIPALVLVSALLSIMFWSVESGRRAVVGDKNLVWIGTGLTAGMVGFTINAQLHNNGLFNDGMLLWWIAGLSIALMALGQVRQEQRSPELLEP